MQLLLQDIYAWVAWIDPIIGVGTFVLTLVIASLSFLIRRLLKRVVSKSALIEKLSVDVEYWKNAVAEKERENERVKQQLEDEKSGNPTSVHISIDRNLREGNIGPACSAADDFFKASSKSIGRMARFLAEQYITICEPDQRKSALLSAIHYARISKYFEQSDSGASSLLEEAIAALEEMLPNQSTDEHPDHEIDILHEILRLYDRSEAPTAINLLLHTALAALRHGRTVTADRLGARAEALSRPSLNLAPVRVHRTALAIRASSLEERDPQNARRLAEKGLSLPYEREETRDTEFHLRGVLISILENEGRHKEACLNWIDAYKEVMDYFPDRHRHTVPFRYRIAEMAAGLGYRGEALKMWTLNVDILFREGESPVDLCQNVTRVSEILLSMNKQREAISFVERYAPPLLAVDSTAERIQNVLRQVQDHNNFVYTKKEYLAEFADDIKELVSRSHQGGRMGRGATLRNRASGGPSNSSVGQHGP